MRGRGCRADPSRAIEGQPDRGFLRYRAGMPALTRRVELRGDAGQDRRREGSLTSLARSSPFARRRDRTQARHARLAFCAGALGSSMRPRAPRARCHKWWPYIKYTGRNGAPLQPRPWERFGSLVPLLSVNLKPAPCLKWPPYLGGSRRRPCQMLRRRCLLCLKHANVLVSPVAAASHSDWRRKIDWS